MILHVKILGKGWERKVVDGCCTWHHQFTEERRRVDIDVFGRIFCPEGARMTGLRWPEMAWWPDGLMAWWPDGLMAWWPDGLMAWWPDGLMAWWPDGLMAWDECAHDMFMILMKSIWNLYELYELWTYDGQTAAEQNRVQAWSWIKKYEASFTERREKAVNEFLIMLEAWDIMRYNDALCCMVRSR